jgi:hypothetical protein
VPSPFPAHVPSPRRAAADVSPDPDAQAELEAAAAALSSLLPELRIRAVPGAVNVTLAGPVLVVLHSAGQMACLRLMSLRPRVRPDGTSVEAFSVLGTIRTLIPMSAVGGGHGADVIAEMLDPAMLGCALAN